VGLGLWPPRDLTIGGLAAARSADEAYIETYTSPLGLKVEELERLVERKLKPLSREDLEDRAVLIERAAKFRTALLCPGDPLVATTHLALVLEASKRGIDVEVFNAPSIVTAAFTRLGLHIYKLGAVTTITLGGLSERVAEQIQGATSRSLHSLLLLEADVASGRFVNPRGALSLLIEAGLVSEKSEVVVLCRLGWPSERIFFGEVADVASCDFGLPPHSVIILGPLHFTERDALDRFRVCGRGY